MESREIEILVETRVAEILRDPVKALEIYKKHNEMLITEVKELRPKADFYDAVASSEKLTEMSAVAKVLNFKGVGRNKLFEYLRKKEILRYNNEPYQEYQKRGYFKVIEQDVRRDYDIINYKTMTTQKGMDFIRKILLEDGYEYNER